jgi:acetyltransferase-like isoleucine patch superfamily enzyme
VKGISVLFTLFLTILSIAGCGQEPPVPEARTPPATEATSASGTVSETMNAAGYTYVQVDTGSEKVWAAAPEFPVKVGDQVVIPEGTPMHNYHSNTLNRDFTVVYFVGSILNKTDGNEAKEAAVTAGHPPTTISPTPPQIDVSGVARAEGGMTISELFASKASLSGKEVNLRGKVVKFNAQIMGKNWLHIRDGSGDASAHTNDLTITTEVAVKVGDTVLVSGKVVLDKDFGYGYKYDVIIEDAKVTLE